MRALIEHLDWPARYAILLVASAVLSWALTPLAGRLGVRLGLVDVPGGRKTHSRPTPRSGGIALFATFWLVVGAGLLIAAAFGRTLKETAAVAPTEALAELLAMAAGAAWIFAVGVWDDRRPMRPVVKLVCQIIAVVPVTLAGIHIAGFLPWPWVGSVLTVFWVVFLINSFNFLDNMDGLTAGVAAIVAVVMAWITYWSDQWLVAAVFVVLAGTLLGFLRHNFSPARIFMGDSGSMFVGYMLGTLTILADYYDYARDVPTRLPILMPLIVLGVPLFDTCSVLWIRRREGKPLMQGDRNHFSHRLVNLGMTERGAVVFIYLVTLCVALGALPLRDLTLPGALLVTLQVVLWFVIIYLLERLGKRASER